MTAGGWHRSELVLAGDVFEFSSALRMGLLTSSGSSKSMSSGTDPKPVRRYIELAETWGLDIDDVVDRDGLTDEHWQQHAFTSRAS
jgi:hypothetical protein